MIPAWLHFLSIAALGLGLVCAVVIAADEVTHPQKMTIMNAVWPLVALFGVVFALWAYFRYGRLATIEAAQAAKAEGHDPPNMTDTPFGMKVAKGAAHCGSGCALGDLIAETLAFAAPSVLTWFGWKWLFTEKMFAAWALDYVFAFALGVAFQYFTIAPMRGLGLRDGLFQAVKADALSLTAWQVGMYGFMAVATFWLFRDVLGAPLEPNSPEFWFMMQIAMICGFWTSYPVNWWLIRSGVKEAM